MEACFRPGIKNKKGSCDFLSHNSDFCFGFILFLVSFVPIFPPAVSFDYVAHLFQFLLITPPGVFKLQFSQFFVFVLIAILVLCGCISGSPLDP